MSSSQMLEAQVRAILFQAGVEDCTKELAAGSISPTEALRVVLDKTSEYRPLFSRLSCNDATMALKASNLVGDQAGELFDANHPFHKNISKWHSMGWYCAAQAALGVQPGSFAGVKAAWLVGYKI